MCGRYVIADPEFINSRYDLEYPLLNLIPNYNVAPGTEMPTVSRNSPNHGVLRKWGLVPFWAKDPKIGYKMINARGETVAEKPSFRKAIRSRRCIVPASGFYEWKREGSKKVPFLFQPLHDRVFSFAGLYETWHSPDGQEIQSYTIITTRANDLVRPIHERMPVILAREDEDTWLDPATPIDAVMPLLQPFQSSAMEAFQVSPEVNNVRNNHPGLVDPV
jgi:putative SOS response-associated peptidase YedK